MRGCGTRGVPRQCSWELWGSLGRVVEETMDSGLSPSCDPGFHQLRVERIRYPQAPGFGGPYLASPQTCRRE